jgi:hypothetical protein
VTYSDFDYREDIFSEDGVILRKARDGPVLLFIGGMYGGRYMAAGAPDALVEANKSRLVVVDKFGMGGTGRVGLEHRINAWLGNILLPVTRNRSPAVSLTSVRYGSSSTGAHKRAARRSPLPQLWLHLPP